jgi:hypothetical protein
MEIKQTEIPTFEVLVKNELLKFNSVIPAIDEIEKQLMPLVITSINDKVGYKAVSEGLRFVISKRTAIESKRKELKADSLAFGKAVDNEAANISKMLAPIEFHLKSQKDKIDNEIALIEQQKKEDLQRKITNRHNILMQLGMNLVGNIYVSPYSESKIENFPSINLETLSEDNFEKYVSEISEIVEEQKKLILEIEAKRIAEQKIIADQLAEIEMQKQLIAKQFQDIANERNKIDEKIKEEESAKAELERVRKIKEDLQKEFEEQRAKQQAKVKEEELAMNDAELFKLYKNKLKDIEIPKMKSKKYQDLILVLASNFN